ncbi:MAG TPA: hypothetical protein VMC06_07410 [Opitutaceae bacterium]|nr:hypothetical protein [Opitutaceae bacterium]
MELSAATLELLQNEAYVVLCREVVQDTLASLEREKAVIASTRPPFGVLATKKTRDEFTRSMRTAIDNEAALRDRLAQIKGFEEWLRPLLRHDIADYLAAVSADYQRFGQVRTRLDDWEQTFQALPEFLVAFARELRNLREAVDPAPAAGRRLGPELAAVGEIAGRLERQQRALPGIAAAIAELVQAGAMSEIRVPLLPDLQRVEWVNHLAALPLDRALTEVACVEKEIRDFLADGLHRVHVRLEVNRDVCTQLENKALEQYWGQLRAHAQAHYVEERDVDEVLAMLAQRQARANLVRQRAELLADPFSAER